jgi:glycosyltransferase involved in cell wall biosynthesis
VKICIFDHLGVHKTTKELEKELRKRGHEVKWNMYYDMREAKDYIEWCDIAIFEWLEGMVEQCLKDGWGKKKPIFCRAMDIEIWANNSNGADLSDLSGLAYTSKAYFDVLKEHHDLSKYPNLKQEHIPLSIDMNEWKFKERDRGYNIAIIGHFWGSKGEMMIPQFARELINRTKDKKWKFYMQGNWRHDVWEWYFRYMKHIIKELELEDNVFLNEEHVDSIDSWLEDKNYLVTFSMKDAFSIIVAEAMAKGIKALPHNFQGAKDIWGPYVWTSFEELYYKIVNQYYNSNEYLEFVKKRYSNDVIIPLWEKFAGIK